jgi:hypothetical protein
MTKNATKAKDAINAVKSVFADNPQTKTSSVQTLLRQH